MQFSNAILAAALFCATNAARFTMTPQFFVGITAGKSYNLTWALDGAGPVTIMLKNGPATVLQTVTAAPTLSGVTGTSAIYTLPASLPNDNYAFEIDENSVPNYSIQFAVTGGTASSSASTTGSSTSASSTSTVTGSSTTTVSSTTSSSSGSSTSGSSTTSSAASRTTGSTSTTSSTTSTSATSTPGGLNSASGVSSPLAMVLLALAAVMTLQ